jgi:hypothetical protein
MKAIRSALLGQFASRFLLCGVSLALLGGAQSVLAATVDFSCISTGVTGECAVGEAQFSVNIQDLGNSQVQFNVLNTGAVGSSIREVYFDDGTLLGISYLVDKDDGVGGHSGVDFSAGAASPPDLPGGNTIDPPFSTTVGFLADTDSPQPNVNAINPGEWLGIVFDLQGGGTFSDILVELANGDLRIGLHAGDFDGYGGSASFVNNPFATVPVPAALPLFVSAVFGLGIGAARRQRKS